MKTKMSSSRKLLRYAKISMVQTHKMRVFMNDEILHPCSEAALLSCVPAALPIRLDGIP